jgi:uncharacterized protein YwgA
MQKHFEEEDALVKDIEKLLVILSKLRVIDGRTRFQKIVFLLRNKESIDLNYNFIPYYYGPYSHELQLEINLLEAAGLVQVVPKDRTLYVHSLTVEGHHAVAEIERRMDVSEKEKLQKAIRNYRKKSTMSLIKEAKQLANTAS